jgi:tetratricopeptide (TPR) repeat protein
LVEAGRPDGAAEIERRAWTEATEGSLKLPPIAESALYLLRLRSSMANGAWEAGQTADAETWYAEAITIGEKAIKQYPDTWLFHSHLAGIYTQLGHRMRRAGRLDAAGDAYQNAVTKMNRRTADIPSFTTWLSDRAWCLARLARVREQQGRLDEARALYASAGTAIRESVERFPNNPWVVSRAAWFFASCPDPAGRDFEHALKLTQRALEKAEDNGTAWKALGLVRLRQGNGPEAVQALLKARTNVRGRDRITDLLLALAYDKAGETALARQEYEQVRQRFTASQEYSEELDRFRTEADEHFRAKGP